MIAHHSRLVWSTETCLTLRRVRGTCSLDSLSSGGSERGLEEAVSGLEAVLSSPVKAGVVLERGAFPGVWTDTAGLEEGDEKGVFRPRSQKSS